MGLTLGLDVVPGSLWETLFSTTQTVFNCELNSGCPSVCGSRPFDWQCNNAVCSCECTLSSTASSINVDACVSDVTTTCFSSEVTVNALNHDQNEMTETKKMSEIEVGDYVLTGNGNYEMVYSIDHRHPTKPTKFLQIDYSDEHPPLEMTSYHMIFLEGEPNPIPASRVQVGDKLQSIYNDVSGSNGNNDLGAIVVSNITSIIRKGLYNPLTADGTIVVNGGIIASTYAALDLGGSHENENREWITIAGYKVMTYQQFFKAILKPYTYICTNVSLELCKTEDERILLEHIAKRFYEGWLRVQDDPNNIQGIATLSFVVVIAQVMDLLNNWSVITLAVSSSIFFAMIVSYSRSYYYNKRKLTRKQD